MKKIICLVLCVLLLTGTFLTVSAKETKTVTLERLGILKGTEKGLEPDRPVTRAEAVVFIDRASPTQAVMVIESWSNVEPPFSDIQGHWACPEIWTASQRYVHGNEDGTFQPEREVTATEFAKMYLCAIGYEDIMPETAYDKGVEIGWLSDEELKNLVKSNKILTRGDVVDLLYAGLQAKRQDGTKVGDCSRFNMYGAQTFTDDLNSRMPENKNYVFSPYSVRTAFALAATGADGNTKTEIESVVGLNHDYNSARLTFERNAGFRLETANSIWHNVTQYPGLTFKQDFLKSAEKFYGATVHRTNDANAVKDVNGWVNEKTHGKIPELISSEQFFVALVNAVYMDAKWQQPFEKDATYKEIFYTRGETKQKTVDFMHQTATFPYGVKDGITVVELRYRGTNVSMYLLMGDEKVENPMAVINGTAMKDKKLQLAVPKFEIEFSPDAFRETLKEMGIRDAFNPEAADFSAMADGDLYIDGVVHKAYIKVDEEGTEASAATALLMKGIGIMPKEEITEVCFNQPFTFAVVDKNFGMPLFVGEVSDFPQAEM